jgi:protoporphyrinogen/coproporphyrinogen III oxidase
MKRIAIIGGGVSGLSAAYTLEQSRRAGIFLEYTLFESSPRFGGVLITERVEDCVVEAGPDSFLTEKAWAADLCHQLGLGDQLIGSNDAARKTYILVNNQLVAMPDGLMFMIPTKIMPVVFSSLFSLSTKGRMALEWFTKPQAGQDESVATLVSRHYGKEMVERLADPLLSGVYGGEASQLGVRAVLPRFAEMEAKYGSLSKGMLAARKTSKTRATPKPIFTSLKNGMQQLGDAMLARLDPTSLRPKAAVRELRFERDRWMISARGHVEFFDAVIVATPAPAAATLLQATSAQLASELSGVPYSSSVTVALGYDRQVRASLPSGFGFLVPRSEGKRMLAATFVHNKFPFRVPEDRALIRCFLGGSRDEGILHLSDEEIVSVVRDELRQILGLAVEPGFVRVYKWTAAMAQYGVGHLERIGRIEIARREIRGLALAGNAYRGIGVPDCVRSGADAANQAMAASGLTQVSQPAAIF